MTPQERRLARLKSDYDEMCNIRGSIIQWNAIKGNAPFITEYELIINVRSIIGPGPTYRSRTRLKLELPSNYPDAPPRIICLDTPKPFHPNWYRQDSRWCPRAVATSAATESLGRHVVRMVRTLQYDGEISNPQSAADGDARDWYLANQSRGWFPSDAQALPDPTTRTVGRVRVVPRTASGRLRVIRRESRG
jgi:ubiquitin-protein ligase